MEKTRAASIFFGLFVVLVGFSIFLINHPSKRPEQPGGTGPSLRRDADKPGGAADARPANPKPSAPAGQEALAAVIVDDLGNNLDAARALCAIGRPVTAAILPFATQTGETVALVSGCGVEIMLHLPLEALVPKEIAAGRISSGMSPAEVRARVNECLDQVPGCRGVNNHEGSRATEDSSLMPVILGVLKERRLYFIDSLTTRDSIAYDAARRVGVPSAVRRVFLDSDPTEDGVRRRLVDLFRAARTHGRAVGIGHARRETLDALGRHLAMAADYGVKLVPASAIVD
jgi:polysaccharide deacetylase 2 family uncharacterized protein YibQ